MFVPLTKQHIEPVFLTDDKGVGIFPAPFFRPLAFLCRRYFAV